MSTTVFSANYIVARQRFRRAATDLGFAIESYPIDAVGPSGESLTIDVATHHGFANVDTHQAIVISSGLHGIEGFFGSAVQLHLLEHWAKYPETRPQQRCIFIHAMNPYGFAWRRRTNENNVDLNRNLILDNELFQGSPFVYQKVNHFLNPAHALRQFDLIKVKLAWANIKFGQTTLAQSVTAGQYDYPQGLFYGGSQPSKLSQLLSTHFDQWLGNAKEVIHFDFHTGLGAWATCQLLFDHSISLEQFERVQHYFGTDAPKSIEILESETWKGGLGHFCKQHAKNRDYICVLAEFGTYSGVDVLLGLREENQCYFWGHADDSATEQAKQKLFELFCPQSPKWRKQTLEKSQQLIEQSIHGLNKSLS